MVSRTGGQTETRDFDLINNPAVWLVAALVPSFALLAVRYCTRHRLIPGQMYKSSTVDIMQHNNLKSATFRARDRKDSETAMGIPMPCHLKFVPGMRPSPGT